MATVRAKSAGKQWKSPFRTGPMTEESMDELKAKYKNLGMANRTPVPTVLDPAGNAMAVSSVANIHHPINLNKDMTATTIPGMHEFFAKTAAGKLTRVVLTDHTFTK